MNLYGALWPMGEISRWHLIRRSPLLEEVYGIEKTHLKDCSIRK